MKKYIYIFLSFFLAALAYGQTACLTTGTLPLNFDNTDRSNSWSVNLYKPSHIGSSGPQTSLSFTIGQPGNPDEIMTGIKIYMRHTNDADYSGLTGFPGTTGFTLVYDGDIPIGSAGKVTLSLNGAFDYDGERNLELLFINDQDKSYSGGVTFLRTPLATDGPYIAVERSGSSWNSISGPSFATRRSYVLLINDMTCPKPWSEGTQLPVTLVNFSGKVSENTALLSWETSSEVNFSHFEIERSFDAKTFGSAGTIQARGEARGLTGYRFQDLASSSCKGIAYYRLKMVDHDNSFGYSTLISVRLPGPGRALATRLYPNPAEGETVSLELDGADSGDSEISLYDPSGRLIDTGKESSPDGRVILKTSSLAPGIYLVNIRSGSEIISRKLIIK